MPSVELNTPGTYDLLSVGVPPGVDVLTEVWGGGGDGAQGSGSTGGAGGGGGGGGFASGTLGAGLFALGGEIVVGERLQTSRVTIGVIDRLTATHGESGTNGPAGVGGAGGTGTAHASATDPVTESGNGGGNPVAGATGGPGGSAGGAGGGAGGQSPGDNGSAPGGGGAGGNELSGPAGLGADGRVRFTWTTSVVRRRQREAVCGQVRRTGRWGY